MIFFAHANGFPAKTYTKLFSLLEDEFEIGFIEKIGHNPKFPVTDNWDCLKNELREEIEKRYSQPIIGIGHSLGGILQSRSFTNELSYSMRRLSVVSAVTVCVF
jgi:surfactin synthase thioesterase subunit